MKSSMVLFQGCSLKLEDVSGLLGKNEPVSNVILWKSKHGRPKQGRPVLNYINMLKEDMGLETEVLRTAMFD